MREVNAYIVEETLTLAVLCFKTFPNYVFWARLCALLASLAFRDANYSHG